MAEPIPLPAFYRIPSCALSSPQLTIDVFCLGEALPGRRLFTS